MSFCGLMRLQSTHIHMWCITYYASIKARKGFFVIIFYYVLIIATPHCDGGATIGHSCYYRARPTPFTLEIFKVHIMWNRLGLQEITKCEYMYKLYSHARYISSIKYTSINRRSGIICYLFIYIFKVNKMWNRLGLQGIIKCEYLCELYSHTR